MTKPSKLRGQADGRIEDQPSAALKLTGRKAMHCHATPAGCLAGNLHWADPLSEQRRVLDLERVSKLMD